VRQEKQSASARSLKDIARRMFERVVEGLEPKNERKARTFEQLILSHGKHNDIDMFIEAARSFTKRFGIGSGSSKQGGVFYDFRYFDLDEVNHTGNS
jgi:hypothetical protein